MRRDRALRAQPPAIRRVTCRSRATRRHVSCCDHLPHGPDRRSA
ncbi:hypothetical protein DB32_007248 [Sandaracinus amylolyticus]|uniref:Uncharacterized protein n=1 Tax=Sandaracinus amylolyticus TaxID=927083 RepID=A0A0F6SHA4_9BACT|nr:hypothetical protein DB32_007248 [Sandaracinus amylolyticus]